MRHLNDRRQLGRNSSHRKAMFRNMATSMFIHGRIKTTHAKAKELRRVVDKLITVGKRYHTLGPGEEDKQIAVKKLHLHRQALAFLKDKKAIEVLLKDLPLRFESRQGGYTRIIKLGPRIGDAAPMAFIELVGDQEASEGKDKKRRRRTGRKKIKAEAEKMTAESTQDEKVESDTEETAVQSAEQVSQEADSVAEEAVTGESEDVATEGSATSAENAESEDVKKDDE